mmetsp:Transcript_27406/g.78970  ORF Transcript_27406/g.78970 Transcript_27406/m.78970 type:complete len:305 (-) Transcript_27406:4-918(-)
MAAGVSAWSVLWAASRRRCALRLRMPGRLVCWSRRSAPSGRWRPIAPRTRPRFCRVAACSLCLERCRTTVHRRSSRSSAAACSGISPPRAQSTSSAFSAWAAPRSCPCPCAGIPGPPTCSRRVVGRSSACVCVTPSCNGPSPLRARSTSPSTPWGSTRGTPASRRPAAGWSGSLRRRSPAIRLGGWCWGWAPCAERWPQARPRCTRRPPAPREPWPRERASSPRRPAAASGGSSWQRRFTSSRSDRLATAAGRCVGGETCPPDRYIRRCLCRWQRQAGRSAVHLPCKGDAGAIRSSRFRTWFFA